MLTRRGLLAYVATSVAHSQTSIGNDGLEYILDSPYQEAPASVKVAVPPMKRGVAYPALYILPVQKQPENGGIVEAQRLDLPARFGVVCVMPSFARVPWYGDHPDNPMIRQESFILKTLVPFVERTFPVKASLEFRWLVGFSKSGWGAFSLALRWPDVFGFAAAWDAPLMKQSPDQWGMEEIFRDQSGFEPYRISGLLRRQAAQFRSRKRLALMGYGLFREHTSQAHELMRELRIAHVFDNRRQLRHVWNSGWLLDAVTNLNACARNL